MDWCLYGDDKRKEMDRDLKPEYLLDDLRRYQDVFGEEFGVKELLMLEDIRVKAMIAGALADMPEFLIVLLIRLEKQVTVVIFLL